MKRKSIGAIILFILIYIFILTDIGNLNSLFYNQINLYNLSTETNQSLFFLIINLILLIWSVLFFLLSPLAIFIENIKKGNKNIETNKNFIKFKNLLTFSGTAIILNNFKFFIYTYYNNSFLYNKIFFHTIINYILLIFGIICFIFGLHNYRRYLLKSKKMWFNITAISFFILIILLINHNLLTI